MLAYLFTFALIAQFHAYKRQAISVPGEEMGELSLQDHAANLAKMDTRLGKLDAVGECCGDKGQADEVATEINTNKLYGGTGEVKKDVFEETNCRRISEAEKSGRGNQFCSYFFVFENVAHADHGYAANCVPAGICQDDVVGMTKGKIATYGVVMQILQQNLGTLKYLGQGPLDKCYEGMTRINEGNLKGLWKEERIIKLGGLNVVADIATGGKAAATKKVLQFDGMASVPAVKAFNKCSSQPNVGYLFVYTNQYWNSNKSDVDLDGFSKFKEKMQKIKDQKQKEAEKAKKEQQAAQAAAAPTEQAPQRRLSDQDAVLV